MADAAPAPATKEALFARLDALDIAHETVSHPPIFMVEEGRALKEQWPGGHSKNLFVKDKKKNLFLIVALSDTEIRLNDLSKRIARGRLSFCSGDQLLAKLGVEAGSVTPFALINDSEPLVTAILDERIFDCERVYFHPLRNDASTAVSPDGLLRFVKACGHAPQIMNLSETGEEGA